jgi:hypothetical protein
MDYSQLVAAVGDLAHRSDLGSSITTFVMLAEAKLNRSLRVRQMEVVLPATPITDNEITLASDIVDVKSLWVPGREGSPLGVAPFEAVLSSGLTGEPTLYCRSGPGALFINGGGEVQGYLYQKIPALSDSQPTNWLLDSHPDVYLYGAMVQLAIYTKDDATMYQAQYESALGEVAGNEHRKTGALRIRAR